MYSPQAPDSPNEKTRRGRARLVSSNFVIVVVLLLAAVCLLWTTEWMDRLQVFGNSHSYSGFVTPKPRLDGVNPDATSPLVEKADADQVYDVFEVDEKSAPVNFDRAQQENHQDVPEVVEIAEDDTEEDDTVSERTGESVSEEVIEEAEAPRAEPVRADDTPIGAEKDEDEIALVETNSPQSRLQVCVVSTNPRTASLFHSKTLQRKGDGKFDYVVSTKKCPAETAQAPVTVRMLYQKSLASMSAAQSTAVFANPENLIIVMGDEFCRCPVDVCSLKAHARQYHSDAYVEFATKYPTEDANPTVYLPLGPRIEFPAVQENEVILSSQRKLLFNLIVSPTSPTRKRLAAMVARKADTLSPVFVHVTPAFAGNASEAKGYVAPEEYRKTLLDSKFTLCPAGHNPEAFRIFEACESGSIPVLVKDEEYLTHACKDSFAPLLQSGAPFIVISNWDELESALRPYRENPKLLDERQVQLREWYGKFWREVAKDFECSIVRNIEKSLQRSGEDMKTLETNFDLPECLDDGEEESEGRTKQPSKAVVTTQSSAKITSTPLIVGCGRTGTLSLSHYLVQAVGVKSVHEKIEPNAISVSWLYAVPDASQYPFEGKRSPGYRKWKAKRLAKLNLPLFAPVVHLVRHPLKVISSTRRCFCGRGTRSTGLGQISDARSWQFVDANIKMPRANLPYDSLLRSMTYWYEWNKLIERRHKVASRFRIEDLDPNAVVKTLGLTVPLGVVLPDRVPKAPSHVSPEKEKELLPDATWADLAKEDRKLAEKIFLLAKEYGYEMKATSLADLM